MVYELVELAREFLLNHNNKPLSFYDEMVLNQQKEEEEALEKERRVLNQEMEKREKRG